MKQLKKTGAYVFGAAVEFKQLLSKGKPVKQMNWRARLLKVAMYSVVNLGRISDVIKLNSYNMKLRERKCFLFLFLL